MQFKIHSFRFGHEIFRNNSEFNQHYDEIQQAIAMISDDDIIKRFTTNTREATSISEALNQLIKMNLKKYGWKLESNIFSDENYTGRQFKVDFAKENLSVEVAFNHGEAISWNLLKPVLASELNHVTKSIQTKGGIIICATDSLKNAGGFDGAVGTFEQYVDYLRPLNNLLTIPLVIIGLEAPQTFRVEHKKTNGKKKGHIVEYNQSPI